jgi:branched-chain amino acid transport system ATP-binding protein
MILEARGLRQHYGDFCALDGVSLNVESGQVVSIIGPNGAGKSTLINVLTGLLHPTAGAVRFKGRDIRGIGPARLARLGLARSFQLVQIFPDLTVRETLQAAVVSRLGRGQRFLASLAADREVGRDAERVAELFGLAGRLAAPARTLPQGDKKLLDVASAFALRPEVILLDEPTSGVSTRDKTAVMEMLVQASRGIGVQTILLVEHDMDIVFGYSDRIVALQQGRVLTDTTPDGLRRDETLMAAVVGRVSRP